MAKYSKLKAFYTSKRWYDFRVALIAERGPVCSRCGKIVTNPLGLIGHHKIELTPENVSDPTIALNPGNVDLVCYDCHNEIHERFGHAAERKVYIVYGAPLSGKHTFVRQQIKRNDIIIDIDALYQAVSGLPWYDKPDRIYKNVMAAHDALIDSVKTRYGKWSNAYIIGGYPEKYKRDALADSLGAELVYCEATQDECIARLTADDARRARQDEWRGYIADWFAKHTE